MRFAAEENPWATEYRTKAAPILFRADFRSEHMATTPLNELGKR